LQTSTSRGFSLRISLNLDENQLVSIPKRGTRVAATGYFFIAAEKSSIRFIGLAAFLASSGEM